VTEPAIIIAAASTALATVLLIRWVAPPPPRLAGRVRPYGANRIVSAAIDPQVPVGSALKVLGRFALAPVARRIGRLVDRDGGASAGLRLRQAGLYPSIDGRQAVEAFRIRQLEIGFGYLVGAVVVSISLELTSSRALVLCLLAVVVAVARQRGAIDRAIRSRQDLMRIEIYTVNQLLAMRVRAGGGVVYAVQQIVARGQGEVVSELAEGLRLHRAGMRAGEAFQRLAATTPEPACARTYALLAVSEERGADLAGALLELSEDVRESRREAMRRAATRRRAAMLVPIIGILAPVMLLFVGAPLPRIIFSWQ
jgi:Flp pilus assembly protein TadB